MQLPQIIQPQWSRQQNAQGKKVSAVEKKEIVFVFKGLFTRNEQLETEKHFWLTLCLDFHFNDILMNTF